MAKPSKRRAAVEKRQNRVLAREVKASKQIVKAAKIAARLMGRRNGN